MPRNFQRTKEDFTCEHCGAKVQGDGYTNHCPACLWSKHVDEQPGDRAHSCLGLMEPIRVIQKHGENRIVHRCTVCNEEKVITARKEDSFEALLKVTKGSSV